MPQKASISAYDWVKAYEAARLSILSYLKFKKTRILNEDLEDVIGVTMLTVLNNLDRYNPALSSFTTWVSVIARNTLITFLARKASRPTFESLDCPPRDGQPEYWSNFLVDTSASADAYATSRERETILNGALTELTPMERKSWQFLREGVPPREEARLTGRTANAVSASRTRVKGKVAQGVRKRI